MIAPDWKKLQKRLKAKSEEPPVPEGMIDARDEIRDVIDDIKDGEFDEKKAENILHGLMQKAMDNPGVPVVIAAGTITDPARMTPSDKEAKIKEMRATLSEMEKRGFKINHDLLEELTGIDLRPKEEEPKPQPKDEPQAEPKGKKVSPELKAIRAACKAAAKRMSEGK